MIEHEDRAEKPSERAYAQRESEARRRRLCLAALPFSLASPVLLGGLAVGQRSPEEAERLNSQVLQLYQQGRHREAIPLDERALAIVEKALPRDHPDTHGREAARDLDCNCGLAGDIG